MFGYLVADLTRLTADEAQRYRSVYCGLCHSLREKYGPVGRLGLNYDMTFLILLLGSLYEPEEKCGSARCVPHPCKKQLFCQNEFDEYAAAMTVLLSRENCLDNWSDDRDLLSRGCAGLLSSAAQKAAGAYPEKAAVIRTQLTELSRLENENCTDPDTAANVFGNLMGELFVYHHDRWEPAVRELGFCLGKFIYLLDAVCDYDRDRKKGSYNPLIAHPTKNFEAGLRLIIGDAVKVFDRLPLVQDCTILKNVLLFGVWSRYHATHRKSRKEAFT